MLVDPLNRQTHKRKAIRIYPSLCTTGFKKKLAILWAGTLYTYHNNDSLKYFYTYMNKRGLLE